MMFYRGCLPQHWQSFLQSTMCNETSRSLWYLNIEFIQRHCVWEPLWPGGASGKEPACQCGCKRPGFNPWVGKIPWRRKWQPSPVFYLENPMDRGAWPTAVHRVGKSGTQLKQLSTHTWIPLWHLQCWTHGVKVARVTVQYQRTLRCSPLTAKYFIIRDKASMEPI